MEKLNEAGMNSNSVDVVMYESQSTRSITENIFWDCKRERVVWFLFNLSRSNCVICLCPDKRAVLQQAYDVLKVSLRKKLW